MTQKSISIVLALTIAVLCVHRSQGQTWQCGYSASGCTGVQLSNCGSTAPSSGSGKYTQLACPSGCAISAVDFTHGSGDNQNWQEWVELYCYCPYVAVSTTSCSWTSWQQKTPSSPNWSSASCAFGAVMTSIEFEHQCGDNLAYQEWWRIQCCPHYTISSTGALPEESKFNYYFTTSTPPSAHTSASNWLIAGPAYGTAAYLTEIEFTHPSGENSVDNESVKATWCYDCGPGYFIEGSNCEPCQAGTSQGFYGQDGCTLCGAGYWSGAASSTCNACTAGKYNPNNGATSSASCISCASGYCSNAGASTCTTC